MDGLANLNLPQHLHLTDRLGYLEFLSLRRTAALVITDSEDVGSNMLVGRDLEYLKREARRAPEGNGKKGAIPALWDGHASEQIADILLHWKQ